MVMGADIDGQTQALDYIDEMTSQDNSKPNMMFASSGAKLTIEQKNMPPIGIATGIFVVITALLGLINGLDYTSPQSGLVRPDEFVYSMSQKYLEHRRDKTLDEVFTVQRVCLLSTRLLRDAGAAHLRLRAWPWHVQICKQRRAGDPRRDR